MKSEVSVPLTTNVKSSYEVQNKNTLYFKMKEKLVLTLLNAKVASNMSEKESLRLN